jgi:hypothetical protein
MSQQTAPQPAFWTMFVCRYLGASAVLARQLWATYAQGCPLAERWHLERCSRVPSMAAMEVVAREALTPRRLLAALEKLAPPGPTRPHVIVALEERILSVTTATGMWR